VVLAVVVLNAAIGFVQEDRAATAIAALASMVTEPATALRDGRWRTVPARDLVRGDVVRLEPGDKIDADARILSGVELRVDESALTGESLAVEKGPGAVASDAPLADRRSMAHAGTVVRAGTGTAVVTATGMDTELGRISALVEQAEALQTPLTRALGEIAALITKAVGVVAVLLLAIALLRGWAVADAALAAVTLAVAAIPEGLPAIVTIALAVGVQRMAARRAIVRRLPAVETLGSTTIIATDKTGTLTNNEMTVRDVWAPSGDVDAVLDAGILCNDADIDEGDPTETALIAAARAAGRDEHHQRETHPRLDVRPFSSEARRMVTLHRAPDDSRFVLVKGAPEVVIETLPAAERAAAHEAAAGLAERGYRVLALTRAQAPAHASRLDQAGELEPRLLGLVGMVDPPRADAAEAVEAVRRAGVHVKMITGDHQATAQQIARQVGLRSDRAVTGAQLAGASDEELSRTLADADVFARVAPEHKLRLVRRLQHDGHVVAMTGDGVNDAPALEQADIGVAMGRRGTSAAREAADLVLADDDFATIRAAVEEGRRVYDNVVKALTFVLPTNLGEALVVLAAVCFFPFENGEPLMPIEPVQILWINLVATVTLALPLAFEARDPRAMLRGPRPPDARLVDGEMLRRTALVATAMAAGAIVLFEIGRSGDEGTAEAQTLAVTGIAFFQCLYLLACRNPGGRVRDIGWLSNRWVYVGIGGLLVLQAAFVYLPFMHELFGTASLDAGELALAAAFALTAPLAALVPVAARRRRV
jgi:calcium-translocating P-type ATPase